MAELKPVARGGHLNTPAGGIDVLVVGDRVVVEREGDKLARIHPVPNYGTAIGDLARRPGFRVGWARMPDGDEVVYLYDSRDHGFGYALNLDAPQCSEWGYGPFANDTEED